MFLFKIRLCARLLYHRRQCTTTVSGVYLQYMLGKAMVQVDVPFHVHGTIAYSRRLRYQMSSPSVCSSSLLRYHRRCSSSKYTCLQVNGIAGDSPFQGASLHGFGVMRDAPPLSTLLRTSALSEIRCHGPYSTTTVPACLIRYHRKRSSERVLLCMGTVS